MRDFVELGSTPCEEDCVQVDPEKDYLGSMREECLQFMDLIRKKLGPEPEGARLGIKRNPHDFGPYLDVVCYYDDEDEAARRYAHLCEAQAPRTWADDKPIVEVSAEEAA